MCIGGDAVAQTKKRLNVTIDRELAEEARRSDLNLSAICETAIAAELRKRRETDWIEANREAIESYNRHVAVHGVFGSQYRKF